MVIEVPRMTLVSPQHGPGPAPLATAKAQFLLTGRCDLQADALAAPILAALSQGASGLCAARSRGRHALVLRAQDGFIGLAIGKTALGAAHFHRAILPFTPTCERGELMRLIEHHEAYVTVKLTRAATDQTPLPLLLQRAMAEVAPQLDVAGLLWHPTGRLHGAQDLQRLLNKPSPAPLLVTPRSASIGPRRLPALRLAGAKAVLGYQVHLHLLEIDRATASAAAYAFLEAALANAALRAGQSFTHAGQTFRISHDAGSRDVTLIPVASIDLLPRAA